MPLPKINLFCFLIILGSITKHNKDNGEVRFAILCVKDADFCIAIQSLFGQTGQITLAVGLGTLFYVPVFQQFTIVQFPPHLRCFRRLLLPHPFGRSLLVDFEGHAINWQVLHSVIGGDTIYEAS